jgi:hypothetical protein
MARRRQRHGGEFIEPFIIRDKPNPFVVSPSAGSGQALSNQEWNPLIQRCLYYFRHAQLSMK